MITVSNNASNKDWRTAGGEREARLGFISYVLTNLLGYEYSSHNLRVVDWMYISCQGQRVSSPAMQTGKFVDRLVDSFLLDYVSSVILWHSSLLHRVGRQLEAAGHNFNIEHISLIYTYIFHTYITYARSTWRKGNGLPKSIHKRVIRSWQNTLPILLLY